VREEERSRIALELHDDLGQQLTGLKLELSWIGARLKEGHSHAQDQFDAARHQLDAAIASVRRIAAELRPLILDELGFGEAVAWLAGELARRSGLVIELDLPAAHLVDGETATALFRIVQESLTNIVRHANARHAGIALRLEGGSVVLTVRDDGCGLPPAREGASGIGLVGMRERALSIGGSFRIERDGGAGTVLRVAIPASSALGLEAEAAAA
jgi:signal transduction histidine kinase